MTVYHLHHIVPKHMGGTDNPDNLIKLTIEEHAKAHLELFLEHGSKYDYIAYLVLSKQIGHEEANYLKLLGPKNWTPEGKKRLSDLAKQRTGSRNPFFGKTHTEETKEKLRAKMSGDNSWIKGIDPKKLSYTKEYKLIYPNQSTKTVFGLKAIAEEFNTSIPNTKATIDRIAEGKIPKRGCFKDMIIEVIENES